MAASKTKRSALLVIDVQQGLFERNTPIYQAEQMLANINLLADRAHEKDVPVVYIQHANEKIFKRGTPAWAFHPEIQPRMDDPHIHKLHGDAFQDTPLHEILGEKEITRVYVTGLVTQGCIRSTCLGALKLGYEVMLVSDAHSTYTKPAQHTIEKWQAEIEKAGATLLPADEITF